MSASSTATRELLLEGIHAPTLASLGAGLEPLGRGRPWTVADLSLGAWRGHALARAVHKQLGMDAGYLPGTQTSAVPSPGFRYADFVGGLIDAEGWGDTTTLTALLAAAQVAAAVDRRPTGFCVLLPRTGGSLARADALFLRFLAEALEGTQSQIAVVSTDGSEPVLDGGWSVRWHPPIPAAASEPGDCGLAGLVAGTPSPAEAHQLAAVLPPHAGLRLSSGDLLIAPEHRVRFESATAAEFDRLAQAAQEIPWLHAYAAAHGTPERRDSEVLFSQARLRFAEGAWEAAMALLSAAAQAAQTPAQLARAQTDAQWMRIAAMRFREAASEAEPSADLDGTTRGYLLQCKGWGLAMTGEPEAAVERFRAARELLRDGMEGTREYLYLLNIFALALLRSGRHAESLALEHEVESRLAALPARDWHLEYVNSINQARLHRIVHDPEAAAALYDRAFAIMDGVRSESDLLYRNVCLARLYEDRGDAGAALASWLRATLHWVANPAPEAVAPRVAAAVLGRRVADTSVCVGEMSCALARHLATARERLFADVPSTDADVGLEPPVFIRMQEGLDAPVRSGGVAYGAEGWGVVLSPLPVRSRIRDGAHLVLQAEVWRTLTMLGGGPQASPATVIVDDGLGRDVPRTAGELLATAVRLRVPTFIFDGERMELTPEHFDAFERRASVQISSAVSAVDTERRLVTFTRYRASRVLTPAEAGLLRGIRGPVTMGEISSRWQMAGGSEVDAIQVVRALERDRVLVLSLSDTDWR